MEEQEAPPAAEHILRQSLEDAERAISFAARRGLEIRREAVVNILDARAKFASSTLDTASAANFWVSFREVSQQIKPVSVTSLRTSAPDGASSAAIKAVAIFRRSAIFALFAVLL